MINILEVVGHEHIDTDLYRRTGNSFCSRVGDLRALLKAPILLLIQALCLVRTDSS